MSALTNIFAPFAGDFDAMVIDSMNAVIAAALSEARLMWLTALSLYIIGMAVLCMWHKVDLHEVGVACGRALVIAFLLRTENYSFYVRDLFFTDLPNTFGAMLGGARTAVNSAQQFDRLWSAVLHVVAQALGVATGMFGWADRAITWFLAILCLIPLGVVFAIWLMGRVFMAILICIGPFLLILGLFKSTRGFVQGWVGRLVGIAIFQLATSVLLRILLVVVSRRLQAAQTSIGTTPDEMHGALAGIFAVFALGAVVMAALPAAVAIGGGSAAATVAATAGVRRLFRR